MSLPKRKKLSHFKSNNNVTLDPANKVERPKTAWETTDQIEIADK